MDDLDSHQPGNNNPGYPPQPPPYPNPFHNQPMHHQAPPQHSSGRRSLSLRWQQLLDQSGVYVRTRWGIFAFLTFLFMYRIITLQGFYIVVYALGIFELNLFIGFLTPLNEHELQADIIPSHNNKDGEDHKPFFRRLPEFQFWYACTNATLLALVLTFFSVFDIPVFWPILLIYFIILFIYTMKRQIQHMIRYRYLPWNAGKRGYSAAPNGRVL